MVTNQVAARGIGNRPGHLVLRLQPEVPLRQAADGACPSGPMRAASSIPRWFSRTSTPAAPPAPAAARRASGFTRTARRPSRTTAGRSMPTEFVDAITCPVGAVQQLEGALRHDAAQVVLPAAQRPRQQSGKVHFDRTATSSSTRSPAAPSTPRSTRPTRSSVTTWTRSRRPRRLTARRTAARGPSRRRSQAGDYAVWVEVNKEFDSNGSHNQTTHPAVFDNQGLSIVRHGG